MDWENNKQVTSSASSIIKKPAAQAGLRSTPVTSWEAKSSGKRNVNSRITTTVSLTGKHSSTAMTTRKVTANKSQNMDGSVGERVNGQQVNGPMVSLNSQVLRRAALMKKTHLRYDEYFDLSEEKRRSSAKQLMNHPYADNSNENTIPTSQTLPPPLLSASTQQRSIMAPSVPNCQLKASKCPSKQAGAPNNALPNSSTANLTNNQYKPSDQSATSFSANGKSYLRSQYERRQLRQLELLSKQQLQQQQQQPPMAPAKLQIADGANIRRHHQQDLVAKSHELSKRRFFEKLERRESIKNLNLSTPMNKEQQQQQQQQQQTQPTTVASLCPSNKIIALASALDEHVAAPLNTKEENLEVSGQKGRDEDELIRQVYQSIAERKVNSDLANKATTHDGSAGAQTVEEDSGTEELAVELIGFYTPSPQLPAEDEQERLIEFSLGERQTKKKNNNNYADDARVRMLSQAAHVTLADITSTKTENLYLQQATNEYSAFEVNVPARCEINGPTMRETGAWDVQANTRYGYSPGLLVVKQVETDGAYSDLLQSSVRTVDSHHEHHVDDCGKRTPTLNGHLEAKVSFRQQQRAADKTNPTSIDESVADNKVRLIKVTDSQTMTLAGNQEISTCAGTRNLAASQEVGDNQQKKRSECISLTISSGNNSSATSDDNSKKSNKMNSETIQTNLREEQTTDNDREVSAVEESASLSEKERVIEVCGASNCAKDHEAPETALLLVKQSGGGADNKTRTCSLDNISSSAYPALLAQQSAAQAQQVASLQTTITKNTPIRHVQPKANSLNLTEAIVSEVIPLAKVVADTKQVNEVHLQRESLSESARDVDVDGYANVLLENEDVNVNEDEVKNNVNLAGSEAERALNGETVDPLNENNRRHHLIESLKHQHRNSLTQEQKSSINDSINVGEEDDGSGSGSGSSSCSSSGFGASASVTSSSDGSSAINVTVNEVDSTGVIRDSGRFQRKSNAVALLSREFTESNYNQQYDCVRNRSRDYSFSTEKNNVDSNGYKELVGPDQAYPKGRVLLVENHNYASLVSIRSIDSAQLDNCSNNIVLERDDQIDGYANLPRKKASSVEYATVRSFSTVESRRITQTVNRDNLNLELNSNSSAHSYSTTSAESGGFSTMPPAKVEVSYVNNFESLDSAVDATMRERKRSSLLKRFGSLVSRAFTSTSNGTGAQSATSLNNDSNDSNDSLPAVDELKEEINADASKTTRQKSALVIEQDHKIATNETSKVQVGEADLVILPTKHINQRKLPQVQQREQNPALNPRHDDDRLSRKGKKLSRKMKKNASSAASTSSSLSSSSSSNSRHHHEEHPKNSDSLFEELESLMSLSEHSTYYQRSNKNKRFTRDRTLASSRRIYQISKNSKACIDIDCISPEKMVDQGENLDVSLQSGLNKSSGPLSLLRLFSSSSAQSRTTESTPDLIVASSKTWRVPSQCALVGDTDKSIDLQQPTSGFWGFSSLISQSHANTASQRAKNTSQAKANSKSRLAVPGRDTRDHDSLIHSSLQPFEAGYRLHLSSEESDRTLDKHQSLNLYRNLLRNYAKRRNHRRGHHHYHHHHHSRAHHSSTTARSHATVHRSDKCAQVCKKSCQFSGTGSEKTSASSSCCVTGNGEKASVWGQLIKINKTDGSQVVELQRSHGKSWGFFVARGAINNVKGIFISRMHDTATSNSLTGLLSIGDRILAIDECPIEPDYDILRVNQMISKRSKIILKVKPFKG